MSNVNWVWPGDDEIEIELAPSGSIKVVPCEGCGAPECEWCQRELAREAEEARQRRAQREAVPPPLPDLSDLPDLSLEPSGGSLFELVKCDQCAIVYAPASLDHDQCPGCLCLALVGDVESLTEQAADTYEQVGSLEVSLDALYPERNALRERVTELEGELERVAYDRDLIRERLEQRERDLLASSAVAGLEVPR